MPRNTEKQAAALRAVNQQRLKLTKRYAFRMRAFMLEWEGQGMSQRQIVSLLNEAEAPVPSEYTGDQTRPTVTKQWSLVQYQRLRRLADEAHEGMVWWAKRNRKSHVQPYGDARGLFGRPERVGLSPDLNRRSSGVRDRTAELEAFRKEEAERVKDPAYRRRKEEAAKAIERLWDEVEAGRPHVPKGVRIGDLTLPHPDEFLWQHWLPAVRTGKRRR